MQEVLEKILAILEAQDAKIKALEAQLEAYGGGIDTLTQTVFNAADKEHFGAFSDKYRSKFEPYLAIMDKLEGGDAFRAIYDKSVDFTGEEGYEEGAYVDGVLADIVETINALKAVASPEAKPALEAVEQAVTEAAVTAKEEAPAQPEPTEPAPEPEVIEETEVDDSAPDEWKNLEKEKLQGRRLF